jgi:hypothetical protein
LRRCIFSGKTYFEKVATILIPGGKTRLNFHSGAQAGSASVNSLVVSRLGFFPVIVHDIEPVSIP